MLQLRSIFLSFLAILGCLDGYGQCSDISLGTSANSGCAPLLVTFTALDAGEGSTFVWNFGNGNVSGQDTMQKAFTSSGKFPVKLIVTLSNGTVCSVFYDTITVYTPPSPVINVAPGQLLCNSNRTAIFTDQTPNVVSREWIIDGTTFKNASSSITYTFASAGPKSVSLVVTDANGCTGVFTNNQYMQLYDSALADFCADINYSGTSVKVKYTPNIGAPGRTVDSVNWNFLGGTPSYYSGQFPPVITYTTPVDTSYSVSMTATMQDGCVYTTTRNSFIQPFISFPGDSMCINVPFAVANKSVGYGRSFFSWQFPGATLVDAANNKIEYGSAGQFDLVLSFKYSPDGCYTNVTYPKAITVAGPSASFNVPVRTGCALPFLAELVNSSVSFGAKNVKYLWHIYNDSTHAEVPGSPIGPTAVADSSIILKKYGKYDVALVAFSGKGCYDSIFKQSYIDINKAKADFLVDDANICLGKTMSFTDATTPADDSANPYHYIWKMQNADSSGINYLYYTKNVQFHPSVPGSYNVTLIVKTASGCSDTVKKLNFAHVNGSIAAISIINNNGCPPFMSNFSANIKYTYPAGQNNSINYNWTVSPNDGGLDILSPAGNSSLAEVSKSNCYNITLHLSDANGCIVKVQAPSQICSGVASGFYIDSSACIGAAVSTHNTSPNKPDNYKWIGYPADGVKFIPADTVAAPQIEYLKDTCFRISLVAFKTYGQTVCTDTSTTYTCTHVPKANFVSAQTQDSCAPQIVDFSNTSLNATSFFWDFGDGETLKTTNTSTSHLYKSNNTQGYDVKLVATGKTGCADTVVKKGYIKIVGPMPLFSMDNKIGCDSMTVNFANLSKNVNKLIMDYGDGSGLDSVVGRYHTYKIQDPALDSVVYYPVLLARDASSCSSFHEDTIRLYRMPVANFNANIFSGCIPLSVSFTNSSANGQTYNWDFNSDGITDSKSANPTFTYTQPGTYNVTLKAANSPACINIKSQTGYIEVYAYPKASFSMTAHHICGSGNVSFNNTSSSFTSYKISYGDGSPDDSAAYGTPLYAHRYSYNMAYQGNAQVFVPSLTVYNSKGCTAAFTDTITIYPTPYAGFYAYQTQGCAPLAVQFYDVSRYVARRAWYYDNVTTPGDTDKNPMHVFGAGLHSVTLKTFSIYGCTDSFVMNNYISADPLPVSAFEAKDTDVCYNSPIVFADKSVSANKISKWQWDFNDPDAPEDTSGVQNPAFNFTSKGYHNVTLKVTDQLGCTSVAAEKTIYVEDTMPPVNSSIDYLSVDDNNAVNIYWNKNTFSKFGHYTLYQDGAQLISGIASAADTFYIQADTSSTKVNSRQACYNIQSTDKCGNVSGLSPAHCTMLLQAKSILPTANQLNWTAYTGWGAVAVYSVYKSVNGAPFALGATLPGNAYSYTDSNLCDNNYCYYIEAQSPSGLYFSQSNRACSHPDYVYQAAPLSLLSISVSGNNSIKVKWGAGIQGDIKKYAIDRLDIQGWRYNYLTTTNTEITDNNVSPNTFSYGYVARAEDDCGNTSPASNAAKSILLDSKIVNDDISLNWTSFKNQFAAATTYQVQVLKPGHKFQTIKTVQDTTFTDDSFYSDIDTAYCYRVIAVDNNMPADTSISNVTYSVPPSRIYVPNAFTPNGDRLNDVWKISSVSVYNNLGNNTIDFNVKVFDRWGALIFESNDMNKGWDGMINGNKADEGTYLYIIRASGEDGRKFYLKGNIELFY